MLRFIYTRDFIPEIHHFYVKSFFLKKSLNIGLLGEDLWQRAKGIICQKMIRNELNFIELDLNLNKTFWFTFSKLIQGIRYGFQKEKYYRTNK